MRTIPIKLLRSLLLVLVAAAMASVPAAALDADGTWSSIEAAEEGDIARGTFCGMDWRIEAGGAFVLGTVGQEQQLVTDSEMAYDSWPWYDYRANITSVQVEGTVAASGSLAWMFYDCGSLVSADLSGLDTSAVKSMASLFSDCISLATLNTSSWDTSAVTDMSALFSCCESLAELDLSSWNTSSVTTMRNMFFYCTSLTSLDASCWNTSSVVDLYGTFSNCSSLTTLNISAWDTSSAETMAWMFARCSSMATLDPSMWKTSNVKDLSNLFFHCDALESLDLSHWNTSAVTDMSWTFGRCASLAKVDVSGWDTAAVTWMDCLFYNCSSLAKLDLSSWNTAKVTSTDDMFGGCTSLSEVRLGVGCTVLGDLPAQTSSGGAWRSEATGVWYTPAEISAGRLGIADTYTLNPFVDVTSETAHADDVLWLADTGISTGWAEADGTKTFRPYTGVVRADMAAFLFRLAVRWGAVDASWQPTGDSPFVDVDEGTPHYREILWLAKSGVSTGWTEADGTKTFRPFSTVVRCDMAAFMRRLSVEVAGRAGVPAAPYGFFCDVDAGTPHAGDVMWLAANGISIGWDEADGTKTFRPFATVVRCDMAAFLHRLDGVE